MCRGCGLLGGLMREDCGRMCADVGCFVRRRVERRPTARSARAAAVGGTRLRCSWLMRVARWVCVQWLWVNLCVWMCVDVRGCVWRCYDIGASRMEAPEPDRHTAPRRGQGRHGARGIPEREPRTHADTNRRREDCGRIVGGLWVDLWEDCGEIVG